MAKKMSKINIEEPIRDIKPDSRKEIEISNQKQMALMYGVFCLSGVVDVLLAFCLTNDFLRLRKTWNIVETSNPIVVFITALTCAMLLNVSMLYFGIELKKHSQRLCKKSELLKVGIMSGATFLITYIFYFMFTMATRSSAYSMRSNGGFQLGGTSTAMDSGDSAILYIALYAAFLPLATSLFSILAGYCSSNPLQRELNIIKLTIIDKQNNLMDVNQALKEAEEPIKHAEFLQKCEIDKYKTYIEHLNLQGLCMTIKAAEMVAKKIDTPEAYSELITKTKEYIDNYKYLDDIPHESLDFIQKELVQRGLDNQIVNDVLREEPKIA